MITEDRKARLEHLNLELIRLLYGKKSEKLSADARRLAFKELEGASVEVGAAAAPGDPSPARSHKRPRPARNLGHLLPILAARVFGRCRTPPADGGGRLALVGSRCRVGARPRYVALRGGTGAQPSTRCEAHPVRRDRQTGTGVASRLLVSIYGSVPRTSARNALASKGAFPSRRRLRIAFRQA